MEFRRGAPDGPCRWACADLAVPIPTIAATSESAAAIALAAVAGSAVAGSSDALTSKTGMTIYAFDKDSAGKSNCNGSCLALWPAVPATEAPSADRDFGSIDREDGSKQLTHKNRPVYYYAQDKKPGDMTGVGADNCASRPSASYGICSAVWDRRAGDRPRDVLWRAGNT